MKNDLDKSIINNTKIGIKVGTIILNYEGYHISQEIDKDNDTYVALEFDDENDVYNLIKSLKQALNYVSTRRNR